MPQKLINTSILVQVKAWCRQVTGHYLNQCCPRSVSLYVVIRPEYQSNIWYPYSRQPPDNIDSNQTTLRPNRSFEASWDLTGRGLVAEWTKVGDSYSPTTPNKYKNPYIGHRSFMEYKLPALNQQCNTPLKLLCSSLRNWPKLVQRNLAIS